MKKFLAIALAAGCFAGFAGAYRYPAHAESTLVQNCKSACLIDANSGKILYEQNSEAHLPIASVCKVMTLNLIFDAVSGGKISLDDTVTVSERAAGMGGSQVFLQSGLSYPVKELIKSIVVCSANDSCVAMSETISGSEEGFVDAMNKKARELGCDNTLFANCTGLPKETQYSCAKDVAVMFSCLIEHEEYFKYSRIWLEDFRHPDDRTTSMTNTNKLIKKYSACDGGKTGFTNEAGFCLAATALRDNLRLVSVVLGGDSSDARFDGTVSLFNYGFSNYCNRIVLDKTVNLNDKLPVSRGKKESVSVRPERDCLVLCAKDEQPDITFNIELNAVCAPISKGDEAGRIDVFRDGVLCDSIPLVCAENVDRASFGDNLNKVAENWGL